MTLERRLIAPRREPRVIGYAFVAITGLALGLLTGRSGPIVIAAPFIAALLIGLRRTGSIELDATIEPSDETIIEGDECELVVRIERSEGHRLLVHYEVPPGATLVEPETPVWDVAPGTSAVIFPVRLRVTEWGQYRLGSVWVEASLSAGLVRWAGRAADAPVTRVLPRSLRLQQLLDPPAVRGSAGVHRSSLVGDGTDFAEVRPFVAGDRVRHLNWRATARLGTPHVNRHHPDRGSDVVVLVDTFGDEHGELSMAGREAVARCARAAWTISRMHLGAQDRVGICGHGRVALWLGPDSGDRARYRILDGILQVGTALNGPTRTNHPATGAIPLNALVIALTPLWDRRMLLLLRSLQMQGHSILTVVVDTTDLVTVDGSTSRRLWNLMLDERRRDLRRTGLAEVLWSHEGDLAAAITRLRGRHRPHVGPRSKTVRR